MYKYEPDKEFERLNEAFLDFFKNIGNKKQTVVPKPVNKTAVEAGGECAIFGTEPNNLFWSELGAVDAAFGRNKNYVKDITEFSLSKRQLRCYDLKKDPNQIAWLFSDNAKFEAEKIWGKPGQIYFQGKWMNGDFKGIMVQPSQFIGGNFKGKYIGTDPSIKAKIEKPGIYQFVINYKGLELFTNLNLIDGEEVLKFKQIQEDVKSNKFISILNALKKMIINGEVDGFGSFPTLKYLFDNEGTQSKQISKEIGGIFQYLVDFKKVILDNIIKKDGTPNEYLKNTYIHNMKNFLGIKPTVSQTTTPTTVTPSKTKTYAKTLKTALSENKLSIKSILQSII